MSEEEKREQEQEQEQQEQEQQEQEQQEQEQQEQEQQEQEQQEQQANEVLPDQKIDDDLSQQAEPEAEESRHETDSDKTEEMPVWDEPVDEVGVFELSSEGVIEVATAPKRSKWPLGILIGVLVLAAVIYSLVQSGIISVSKDGTQPVVYAKDNGMYVYDLHNDPYQVVDTLPENGVYTMLSEDGRLLYYAGEIAEDQTFPIYKRVTKATAGDAVLVTEKATDFQISEDGMVCAYSKKEGESLNLYSDLGKGAQKLTEGISEMGGSFVLSKDGTQVAFVQEKNEKALLFAVDTKGGKPQLLTEKVAKYLMSESTNAIYYMEADKEAYRIFEYLPGQESIQISENVKKMQLLPEDDGIFFTTQIISKTPVADLVKNDVTDADTDRRALLKENISMPATDVYVWQNGKAEPLALDVRDANIVQGDYNYILYGRADTSSLPKIPLSEVTTVAEIQDRYLKSLNEAETKMYLQKPGKTAAELSHKDVYADFVWISPKEDAAAYAITNPLSLSASGSQFMLVTASIAEDGTLVGAKTLPGNLQGVSFTGTGGALSYMVNYSGTGGSLKLYQNGEETLVSDKAGGYMIAEDGEEIYYVADINPETALGTLYLYENGTATQIAENVFSFQYKGNGALLFLTNYDMTTGTGDLFYWNGKKSIPIDTGIAGVFSS